MKKLLTAIAFLTLITDFSFAQDAASSESVEATETAVNEIEGVDGDVKSSWYSGIRAGGFLNYDPAVGEMADYVSSSIGGGLSLEVGIPLPVALLKDCGISTHIAYGINPVKDDNLDSMSNLRLLAGGYFRVPFSKGFIFQPELSIGAVLNFPKAGSDANGELKSCYIDQIYQLALGLRYANPKMCNGKLEIEFSPAYTLCPESGNVVQYIGARLGFLYSVK